MRLERLQHPASRCCLLFSFRIAFVIIFPRPLERERCQLLLSLSSERQPQNLFFSVQGLILLHAVVSNDQVPKMVLYHFLRQLATATILSSPHLRKERGGWPGKTKLVCRSSSWQTTRSSQSVHLAPCLCVAPSGLILVRLCVNT